MKHFEFLLFIVLFFVLHILVYSDEEIVQFSTVSTPQDVSFFSTEDEEEYLRIKSVQPNPDYAGTTAFLKKQASRIGLDFEIIEFVKGKPVVIMEWKGTDPHLKSILLNSHTDVVPVEPEHWKYDPFGAIKTPEGNIYARGAQDMKCVGMQYLEAIDKLKKSGFKPKRSIYLSYVPDEEIGGEAGMGKLVASEKFKKMNIGFGLDEGLANPTEAFSLYYGERGNWWFNVIANGKVGHGSQFIDNTATEKLYRVIDKVFKFRESQITEMKLRGKKSGEVITINLTSMKAGHTQNCGKNFSMNVIPASAQAGFDMRIPPGIDYENVEKLIKEWTSEEGVTYEFVYKSPYVPPTDISDKNPWWRVFKSKCDEMGLKIETTIFPAATDSRYIRGAGNIPVFGFSPMNNTPILLHDHNEFLNEKVYLNGIKIYSELISVLANNVENE